MYNKPYWDKKIDQYYQFQDRHNPFAEQVAALISDDARVLEIGCGPGFDGLYFAAQHEVVLTDASDAAFGAIKKHAIDAGVAERVSFATVDLLGDFSIEKQTVDVVYAHLVLHYFTDEEMARIVAQIRSILRPGGVVAVLTNSTDDSEYIDADRQDMISINGISKRFFTPQTLREQFPEFEVLVSDNEGVTTKDTEAGNPHLIRFVGRML